MTKPTKITNSMRTLRFARGEMTQAQLATQIGVTRQTIIAIETRTTRSVRAKTAIGYVP